MLDLHLQQLVGHGQIADLNLEAADLGVAAIGRPALERSLAAILKKLDISGPKTILALG